MKMNNRLKFRVWDTKHKKFLIGIPPMEYMLDHDEWSHHDIQQDPCVYLNNVFSKDFNGRLIFQQYTGLTDKNKKEIYEGDILDFTARYKQTGPVEVIYYGASFGCVVTDDGGLEEFWALNHIVQQHYPEIIGNIFENPELLKTI
jgi:uncharacterized phage protein (TIGR01671 family)